MERGLRRPPPPRDDVPADMGPALAYADSMLDNFRGLASRTRAAEPTAPSRLYALRQERVLRQAVVVDLPDGLKLSRPVFAFDRAGSREAIVTHPGHDDGEAQDLRYELEYEAQKRDAQYEDLTLGTVWVTPAYLFSLAADSELPVLMKLMDRISIGGVDLDVHLDIEVVASYFAGPETMEAARLMKFVDDGVGFFQQYATTPEKARFLDLPAVALLRIHAVALQDVGRFAGPEERVKDWGDIHYESSASSENIRIEWSTPREKKTGGCVQISAPYR